MMNEKAILKIAKDKGLFKSADLMRAFGVTRQYVSQVITPLVKSGVLLKVGSTRGAGYILPERIGSLLGTSALVYVRKVKNVGLEEHKVLADIERSFLPYKGLHENIKSIFTYAFSEMLNNAIEHSGAPSILITVTLQKYTLSFIVDDTGIGVFRNIMQKRHLKDELEAIQDLLKGKMTTAPKLHSGEGIFFTSKVGDTFTLSSYGHRFLRDNTIPDIFVEKVRGVKKGTRVMFSIDIRSRHHLNDVFRRYTHLSEESGLRGFDKTEIRVRLYTMGGIHISRSQARRVLADLEKFSIITMDYDKVPMVGQAFADEVYRVFKNKYPGITIENVNMNESVRFMVERAKKEARG